MMPTTRRAGAATLASQYGIAIVVFHHLRKEEADDAFDTVSGTLGLTGALDTILVLKREPAAVVLHGRGRDLIEIEKAMTFNEDSCVWTMMGSRARSAPPANARPS